MTRAIILAAGQGTRLRPLTEHCPKCLIPFIGKPLLDQQTDVLRACGVDNIHVVAGYCADQIQKRGYICSINQQFSTTNMVETLFSAIDYLTGSDDLLISYGDIIYQSNNLREVLSCDADISIMCDTQWKEYWSLRFADPLSDAETFKFNQDGYITELGKKPHAYSEIQGQYTGLTKIRADRIPAFIEFYQKLDRHAQYDGKDFKNMYMTSFLQTLIHDGWKIKAVPVKNGWLEVDSINDLNTYETLDAQGKLARFYQPG